MSAAAGPDGLEAAAQELYGLDPPDFVAAREALAAEARRRGERELARAVRGLRRPTASAWLANLLVRERRAEVDQLLAFGAALRDAQEQLDAGQLRELARQRHHVVAGLAAQAASLGQEHGAVVSDTVRREVLATLEAALTDPGAGATLLAGQLATALVSESFGLVGGERPCCPPRRRTPRTGAAAEEALRDRREERAVAQERLDAAQRRVTDLEARHHDAVRHRHDLEEQLDRARADEAGLADDLAAARIEVAARADVLEGAQRAEEQAGRGAGPPT